MAKAYVRGAQSKGVVACVKHFADNNQVGRRYGIASRHPPHNNSDRLVTLPSIPPLILSSDSDFQL